MERKPTMNGDISRQEERKRCPNAGIRSDLMAYTSVTLLHFSASFFFLFSITFPTIHLPAADLQPFKLSKTKSSHIYREPCHAQHVTICRPGNNPFRKRGDRREMRCQASSGSSPRRYVEKRRSTIQDSISKPTHTGSSARVYRPIELV